MNKELPKPQGYRMLLKPWEPSDKSSTTWCKPGDYVLTGKYVGLKFKYENADYSIINDDEVVAVVPNPEKIKHR